MKLSILFQSVLISGNPIADRFSEGGTFFMSAILICLLLSLFFIVKGFLKVRLDIKISKKMLQLAVDTSLLGLVIGFLASVLGLITAFDSLESIGQADSIIFAGGLKVSLLSATFGLVTFIIARIGIVVLRAMQNE